VEMNWLVKATTVAAMAIGLMGCASGLSNVGVGEQSSGDLVRLTFAAWHEEKTKRAALENRAREICGSEVFALSNLVSNPYSFGTRGISRISAVVTCGERPSLVVKADEPKMDGDRRRAASEAEAANRRREADRSERRATALAASLAKAVADENARKRKLETARGEENRRVRIVQAQGALYELGLYKGKADGVSGPRTRAAVAEWFRENGRDPDEDLTDAIVAKMGRQAKNKSRQRTAATKAARDKRLNSLRLKHRLAVAVIIGNRNYSGSAPDVAFAGNDADAVRDFVTDNLGYREGNIIDLRDASLTLLNATFGTASNHRGRLFDYVREGKSDVIVFYSGHGVPGLHDRKGYLLPVDADPNRAELNGYPLDTLLANLAKVPARSMAVYIDACFSGESQKGMLVQATSGITVQAKVPNSSKGMVVVTAARNDQFASWDEDAKHGLFTKHLLEALRGKADGKGYGNGDGKVTLSELRSYLDEEMTYQARRRWSRDQNASVQGADSAVLSTLNQ
jgi:peptidoglycan hydrolase-like protein with peptidoglycan-binding domain